MTAHLWISGDGPAAGAAAASAWRPEMTVSCDRRLRGPYTGAGSVLRALVPLAQGEAAAAARRHAVEILAAAPELGEQLGPAPGTLTTLAPPHERTRWYSRLRTRRIAHGIVEFLADRAAGRPMTLAFTGADHADATDREFLAIAVRRLDPSQVRLVVCSHGTDLGTELGAALAGHSQRQELPRQARPGGDPGAAAAAFIAADGTSDVVAEREAYERMDPLRRAEAHDQRADELERRAEWSLRLGAIPYHREHGTAAGTEGKRALAEAVSYCVGMGFYDAGLELATRLAAMLESGDHDPAEQYVALTQQANCLALLGRAEEIEPIYYDLLSRSASARWHMNLSYAFAMLYTRLHSQDKKDHRRALAHINTAVALASQLPDARERAFHAVFMDNGKALIEMHMGDLEKARLLVAGGIERLDRELPPDMHRLHRSVLHHNHAQVLAALGRPDEALKEFGLVIDADPNYPEYYFDRGNLLSKTGAHAAALADYEMAARLGPPFPELFYNRGDLRARAGDLAGAISDFGYVLDLEPDHGDAAVALADTLIDAGEVAEAVARARAALARNPGDARLHCALGLALIGTGQAAQAHHAFSRAIELDSGLFQALSGRATAAFELGRYDESVADLTAALEASEGHPDLLYNRGIAYQAAGRPELAIADYSAALGADGADIAALLLQRSRCHELLGRADLAAADLAAAGLAAAGLAAAGLAAADVGNPMG